MPQHRVKRQKAITVAAVLAFFLAFVTAMVYSMPPTDPFEELSLIGTFIASTMVYFVPAYLLSLLSLGMFDKENNDPT